MPGVVVHSLGGLALTHIAQEKPQGLAGSPPKQPNPHETHSGLELPCLIPPVEVSPARIVANYSVAVVVFRVFRNEIKR